MLFFHVTHKGGSIQKAYTGFRAKIHPCQKVGYINSPCGTDSNKRPDIILRGGWVRCLQ